MRTLQNFIDGQFKAPTDDRYLDSFNPATGSVHLRLPDSGAADVALAVQAAQRAFAAWSRETGTVRAAYLYKIADLVDERAQLLAEAESSDQGKPVWLARKMDIERVAHNFRFFAGAVLHAQDASLRADGGSFSYISRRPIGVAGLISPWNLPLYLLSWKIAPAIAFGNTVVCKPSEFTSLTAHLLGEILHDAGVPKGVVNIVFGNGPRAGQALVEHPGVPLISFTGGTVTGRAIAQTAAGQFKKLSLELGGKNPNIIFADADFEKAVETTVRSSFLNQGEICLCGSRIYVEAKIYERFLSEFVARTEKLKVGDPKDPETFIGPLVSREHLAKVESFLQTARGEKLQILTGGERAKVGGECGNGYFLKPTIITGALANSSLQQEEIFGPVVTVTPFHTDEEAFQLANGVKYGLSATVWTSSLTRAHAMAEQLEVGTVWVNTWLQRDLRAPFGGVKASGMGREGQTDSRDFFTETKTICIRHGELATEGK